MAKPVLGEKDKNEVLRICREEASPDGIVAASLCSLRVWDSKDERNDLLIVLSSPKLTLRYRSREYQGKDISILAVDQKTFEKDVDSDWLGGLLVENLLVPYEPLVNKEFLQSQEVKAKKRVIVEILDNLIHHYPETSHELLIEPEYFMYEEMARKTSLYPPIACRFLSVLGGESREANVESMMSGFKMALQESAEEGTVTFTNSYVKIAKNHIEAVRKRKLRLINILRNIRNSLLRHSLEVFPKMMVPFLEDYTRYIEQFVDPQRLRVIRIPELENTESHILIPTSSGLVPLSDKITIQEFVQQTFHLDSDQDVEIEKLGGALNSVYALQFHDSKGQRKIVAKVYRSWHGWKWFPLALWTLGTRSFAVLGKSRLEKEYAISVFLSDRGLNVPKIVGASPKAGLLFQEFVEGDSLLEIIKIICSAGEERPDLTDVINLVGAELAKVHSLNVALGDCKPENIIVKPDRRVYFIDLEQAERGGDQAWDLAELLYYSGHHASFSSIEPIQKVTRSLIQGYVQNGGDPLIVKKVSLPKYVKVFSFFTPPHIMLAISKICQDPVL